MQDYFELTRDEFIRQVEGNPYPLEAGLAHAQDHADSWGHRVTVETSKFHADLTDMPGVSNIEEVHTTAKHYADDEDLPDVIAEARANNAGEIILNTFLTFDQMTKDPRDRDDKKLYEAGFGLYDTALKTKLTIRHATLAGRGEYSYYFDFVSSTIYFRNDSDPDDKRPPVPVDLYRFVAVEDVADVVDTTKRGLLRKLGAMPLKNSIIIVNSSFKLPTQPVETGYVVDNLGLGRWSDAGLSLTAGGPTKRSCGIYTTDWDEVYSDNLSGVMVKKLGTEDDEEITEEEREDIAGWYALPQPTEERLHCGDNSITFSTISELDTTTRMNKSYRKLMELLGQPLTS